MIQNDSLLVYAGNLHVGGAIGGAANFITALVANHREVEEHGFGRVTVQMSSAVYREVDGKLAGVPHHWVLEVRDDKPSLLRTRKRGTYTADVRFTYRGPAYQPRAAKLEICGFADRSLFSALQIRPVFKALREKVMARVKFRLLSKYDGFTAQTPSMAAALEDLYPDKSVLITPNRVGEDFLSTELVSSEVTPGSITAFYPARAYPHKNHRFIDAVGEHLRRVHNIQLRVTCTVTEEELQRLGVSSAYVDPVGVLTRQECLEFYQKANIVFFPSENETFSVTPLEAMALGRPFIAGDHPFIHETVGDLAFYYVPGDVAAASERIVHALEQTPDVAQKVRQAREFVRAMGTADNLIESYLAYFKNTLHDQ